MKNKKSKFIWYTGIGVLIFVILAFGSAAIVQPYRIQRYVKPLVIVHISLVMSWLFLFVLQSRLVLLGRMERHRKNVNLGLLLVFVITIQAIYLTYLFGSAVRFVGESRDVLAFSVLFIGSIWAAKKGNIEMHKRFMLIACINLLGPAFMRLGFVFNWSDGIVVLAMISSWIVIPISYDLVTRRSIHKASIIGIAFTLLSFVLILAIIFSPLIKFIEAQLFAK